jgi:LysR family hydrogen peroxide-inducible transcriptional activator
MEVHQLRYFAALARTGNFSRAAEQCRVSQPSLSQQIQKLEEEVGERLFDRRGRATRLTAHGETLRHHAIKILDELEAAKRAIAEGQSLVHGTLALGVLPTIAPYFLPPILADFAGRYPGVHLLIQEDTTARLLELVLSYELDCAIVSLPIQDGRLEIERIFTEELLLALPPGHRLARRRRLTPADFETERLIVMKEGHCLGDQVLGFCERREIRPAIAFRSAQLETIQALVRAGLGLSLVPAMAVRAGHGASPLYRSLPEPRPSREIVTIWPRLRPPDGAAREFLHAVRAHVKAWRRAEKSQPSSTAAL